MGGSRMSKKLFNVSDIEFDYNNDKLTFDEEIAVRDLALGVYESDDENDLLDEITEKTGYDIINIYNKEEKG